MRPRPGHDKRLQDLIGELSTRSEDFRVRWARHDVKLHRRGAKRFHHPVVGDVTLDYEALEIASAPGHKLVVYTAEPGSPARHALDLLASWASSSTPEERNEWST